MNSKYYVAVRPQTNDHHAVHKEGCPFLPDDEKRIYLGTFNSGKDAMRESQRHFVKTKGCLFCSKEHMTGDEKQFKSELKTFDKIIVKVHTPLSHIQSMICCLN
jgi:hypothetical protein